MKKIFGFDNINILENFKSQKLHNCVMLIGKKGIGKASFIYNNIANLILSQNSDIFTYNKHSIEETNKLIENNSHPDLLILDINSLDEDGKENTTKKQEINVSQVRNIISKTNLTASLSKNRVIIIDSIDEININGQNALLKTLEEPNKNTYIFIICHNENNVLDTIKSRCSVYKIHDLSYNDWKNAILQENKDIINFDEEDIMDLYNQSNKSVSLALQMIEFDIFNFQNKILELLLNKNILEIHKFSSDLEDNNNFYMFKISMDIIFNKLFAIFYNFNNNINNNIYYKLSEKLSIKKLMDNYEYFNKIISDISIYNLSKTHCINVFFNKF